jgi:hypothetical protein
VKSLLNISGVPAATPIIADEILEFHAARLLLLFRLCGTKNAIDGLTKMAKLDFFVRYPQFFEKAVGPMSPDPPKVSPVESSMVRHHYGPWDKRYYHVLAYLEGKQLLQVSKTGSTFLFELTPLGVHTAELLRRSADFQNLATQMKAVKKSLGSKSGSGLKKLIYDVFKKEVSDKEIGEVIV